MMDMFNRNEFPHNPDNLLDGATQNVDAILSHKILEIPLGGGYLRQELFGKDSIFGYSLEKLDPFCFTEVVKGRKVNDEEYLTKLHNNLSKFLETVKPNIVFYNAGTDPYKLDPWGCMNLSKDGIIKRDMYVWEIVRQKNIPIVMTLSGGYSPDNVELVSQTLTNILNM